MSENALAGLTLNQFLDRLGADEPTPGGGSVAAMVGAMAAGLGQMTCNFTLGREKFADVEDEVQELCTRLTRAGQMLRRLIDEDAEAYAQLSNAFKTPKDAPDRKVQIATAAAVAAGVPFQTAALSKQVLRDLETLRPIANPRLLSDVDAGMHLAKASLASALANVRINLPYIGGDDAKRLEEAVDKLTEGA